MFKNDLDSINGYMRNHNVSRDLRIRVFNYLEHKHIFEN